MAQGSRLRVLAQTRSSSARALKTPAHRNNEDRTKQHHQYNQNNDDNNRKYRQRVREDAISLIKQTPHTPWHQQNDAYTRFALKYKTRLKIATVSCQGLNAFDKREELTRWAIAQKMDIVLLQETRVNSNSTARRYPYTFYFSSGVKPADLAKKVVLARE